MNWNSEIFEVANIYNLTPSLSYWMTLLNWAEEHQDDLTITELSFLADESERCRKFWNRNRIENNTITKNGKPLEQKIKRMGLGIRKEDVFPNIHKMLEEKIRNRIENPTIELNPNYYLY